MARHPSVGARRYLRTVADRLEQYSVPEPTSGCRLWLRSANRHGYGMVFDGVTKRLAHVVSWEQEHGPVPCGLCVLHRCDVTFCIEPNHLFLGTMADNTADMWAKGRGKSPGTFRGSQNKTAKLDEAKVAVILRDPRTHRLIAEDYGVHTSLIWLVKARKIWRHVS